MTGIGDDGATGARRMRDAGAKPLGLDEATRVEFGILPKHGSAAAWRGRCRWTESPVSSFRWRARGVTRRRI